MKRKSHKVVWDQYGIVNNPTEEATQKELDRLIEVQKKQVWADNSITNIWITARQSKINLLKARLWK